MASAVTRLLRPIAIKGVERVHLCHDNFRKYLVFQPLNFCFSMFGRGTNKYKPKCARNTGPGQDESRAPTQRGEGQSWCANHPFFPVIPPGSILVNRIIHSRYYCLRFLADHTFDGLFAMAVTIIDLLSMASSCPWMMPVGLFLTSDDGSWARQSIRVPKLHTETLDALKPTYPYFWDGRMQRTIR